jgi:hypothetical protein
MLGTAELYAMVGLAAERRCEALLFVFCYLCEARSARGIEETSPVSAVLGYLLQLNY